MKINDLFNQFFKIDEIVDNQLLEVSVKQHGIILRLKQSIIGFSFLDNVLDTIEDLNNSFISVKDDVLYITLEPLSLDDLEKSNIYYPFIATITDIADKVCTCPALEFVVSDQYIKCFLDKPGLKIEDLVNYEKVLKAKGKGELVLHPQRPYLLFINEGV